MNGWRSIPALLVAALALAGPSKSIEVVGIGEATFHWEAASGPVAAYLVYVSRNGAPFPQFPEQAVQSPHADVPGKPGETVVVAVAALTAAGQVGPLSERSHPVRFSATPTPPAIGVGSGILFGNVTPGEFIPTLDFQVLNTGGGQLDFQVTTATPWLSATPTAGSSITSDVPVSLRIDPAGLNPGTYFSAAYVTAAGAMSRVVPVVVSVWPPVPEFTLSRPSMEIPALLGGGIQEAVLEVTTSLPAAAYTLVADEPWLSTGYPNGMSLAGSRTLYLQADPAGLPRGTHSAHVHVIPHDERVVARTVDVTLTVVDPLARPAPLPDLNGDGRADLLFRDRVTGQLAVWLMNGAQRLSSATIAGPVPAVDWRLVAVADLDADGRADLLWQHQRLPISIGWGMNGAQRIRTLLLPSIGESGWRLAGAADFTGDGTADLLWHHPDTGRVRVLRLTGGSAAVAFDPERVGEAVAEILGTGDFDATGTADVVWKTSQGRYRLWLSTPDGLGRVVPLESPGESGWVTVGVGDLDGDGKSDLVWRNDTLRESRLWRFESPTVIEAGELPDLRRPGWRIAALRDLDGDGETDLVWRSAATGEATVWLMEGFTVRLGASITGVPLPAWEIRP